MLIDEGDSELQVRQGGLVLLIFLLLASQEDADLVGVSWKPNRVQLHMPALPQNSIQAKCLCNREGDIGVI